MRSDQVPAPQPWSCSVRSAELGEPVTGTATTQSAWLALEQPGPWGRDAIVESQLDREVGAELDGRADGTGVRLALMRRPGAGQDHAPRHRRWFAASTHPGRSWLATGTVEYPTDLLRIDFAALDAGNPEAVKALDHELTSDPVLLVCTNGRRDQCCATLGRKVALSADALDRAAYSAGMGNSGAERLIRRTAVGYGRAVWETTHIGGHKFAPTAVLLPYGYVYGRVDAAQAVRILHDARRDLLVLDGCRGRTTWSRAGQAAELAVRTEIDERGLDAIAVTGTEKTRPDPEPAWTVELEHADGRRFRVGVHGAMAETPRPESCGKADGTPLVLTVGAIDEIR